jgi:FkbM family methyltransferase
MLKVVKNKLHFYVNQNYEFWKNYQKNKYEDYFFKYINKKYYSNFTFVDIGASIGALSLYCSYNFKKVISLEPDKQAFKDLKNNIHLNEKNIRNIKALNYALLNHDKKIKFSYGEVFSSIHFLNKQRKYDYLVKGISLKKLLNIYIKNKLFFLKIDIEGYEFTLFKDREFLEIIKKYKPPMYFAIHLGANYLLKYKIAQNKFFQPFFNLGKTIVEYNLIFNILKNYSNIRINNIKVSRLFFLKAKFYRKNIEIYCYN